MSTVHTVSVSDYGPAEEAYLQKSNYSKAPNTHFTVAKPAARKTVSRDLLTSSLNTRAGLVSSKPGIPGGANRPPGSILSSSGNVSSRALGSSSSGIGSPSRPSSSVLGSSASRPEGVRRFVPAAAPVQDDMMIMMVDPIAMAMQEQQKKDEEKRKKEDVKAARVAKKAAAEARKEGKEEDAGVLQLGKLSQSFENAKPPKKKPKLKEGEVPSGTSPTNTTSAPQLPPSLTAIPSTAAATTATTATTAKASGNSNDFADAFLAAAEVAVPGAAPTDVKPKITAQPPSLVSHQAAGGPQQLVTSGSHLPIYGKVTSTPSSSINQATVPPSLVHPMSATARPPTLVSGAPPSTLKSFNATALPVPLASMAPTGGLMSLQPSSGGIALPPSTLAGLGPRPLTGPSIAPSTISNVSYTPTQHVFHPMSAYNNPSSTQGQGGLSSVPVGGLPSSAPISISSMPPSLIGARPVGMPTPMVGMPGVVGGGLSGLPAGFSKQPVGLPTGQPLPYGAFPTQAPMPMSTIPSMAPNFGTKPAALTSAPAPLPLNKPSLAQPTIKKE